MLASSSDAETSRGAYLAVCGMEIIGRHKGRVRRVSLADLIPFAAGGIGSGACPGSWGTD